MRVVVIIKGDWLGGVRRFRRRVYRGMKSCGFEGDDFVAYHEDEYTCVSPVRYLKSEVLGHRIEPEFDKSTGRSSKSQSGYDLLASI